MQFLETSLHLKKMHDWDVQSDLIYTFMCLLSYLDFFQCNVRGHFLKIYFSKLTLELIQYFVLHIYPLFLDSNFCYSTGINTLPQVCKETAGVASDDQFLKSQMLAMLDQWMQDPRFFFSKCQCFYICCQFSWFFSHYLNGRWCNTWNTLLSGGTWLRILALIVFYIKEVMRKEVYLSCYCSLPCHYATKHVYGI